MSENMHTEIEKIAEQFVFHYNDNDFYPLYRLLNPDAVMQLDDGTMLGSDEIVKYFKQLKFQNKQEMQRQECNIEKNCFQINAVDGSYKIKFNLEHIEKELRVTLVYFGFLE